MENLLDNLDLENLNYYYHITSKGFAQEILNEGLFLEENSLESTTIKLTEDIIDNFFEYCKSEYNSLSKRDEMVIISCLKDEEDNLIVKSDIPMYKGSQKLQYLIRSENILGYIDLRSLNVEVNPDYINNFKL